MVEICKYPSSLICVYPLSVIGINKKNKNECSILFWLFVCDNKPDIQATFHQLHVCLKFPFPRFIPGPCLLKSGRAWYVKSHAVTDR